MPAGQDPRRCRRLHPAPLFRVARIEQEGAGGEQGRESIRHGEGRGLSRGMKDAFRTGTGCVAQSAKRPGPEPNPAARLLRAGRGEVSYGAFEFVDPFRDSKSKSPRSWRRKSDAVARLPAPCRRLPPAHRRCTCRAVRARTRGRGNSSQRGMMRVLAKSLAAGEKRLASAAAAGARGSSVPSVAMARPKSPAKPQPHRPPKDPPSEARTRGRRIRGRKKIAATVRALAAVIRPSSAPLCATRARAVGR